MTQEEIISRLSEGHRSALIVSPSEEFRNTIKPLFPTVFIIGTVGILPKIRKAVNLGVAIIKTDDFVDVLTCIKYLHRCIAVLPPKSVPTPNEVTLINFRIDECHYTDGNCIVKLTRVRNDKDPRIEYH